MASGKIEQGADPQELSANTLWSSHGAIERTVSRNISIRQVARKIERVADPREFSGNTMGSSRGAIEHAFSGNIFISQLETTIEQVADLWELSGNTLGRLPWCDAASGLWKNLFIPQEA